MPAASKDQLKQFVSTYKSAFKQAGGREDEIKDEQTIIQKMEKAGVQNDQQARDAGRKDGEQSK